MHACTHAQCSSRRNVQKRKSVGEARGAVMILYLLLYTFTKLVMYTLHTDTDFTLLPKPWYA